jgi:hypothetical protein
MAPPCLEKEIFLMSYLATPAYRVGVEGAVTTRKPFLSVSLSCAK